MSTIYLRRAQRSNLNTILSIINNAKEYLKKQQIPQWQDGHPDRASLEHDIATQTAWVLIYNNQVAGFASLQLTPEPTYQTITNGSWAQPNQPYGTIHRVAISNQFRGHHLSQFLFANLLTIGLMQDIKNFRIDTHPANKKMQDVITKNGFVRRGTILVDDQCDPHRIVYELNLGTHNKVTRVNNNFMQGLIDELTK